jgi:hypothetical protein
MSRFSIYSLDSTHRAYIFRQQIRQLSVVKTKWKLQEETEKMRKKLLMVVAVLVAATALVFSRVVAQDTTKTAPANTKTATETKTTTTTKTTTKTEALPAPKYTYVGKEKCKLCHKVAEYDSWSTTVHAKAWEALKPEEQKNDSCIVCHSTGKDAAGVLLTGVQCEACHGPGSAYKSQANMKDKKLAMAAGLIEPTKEVCVKCHNDKSPNFKGFDFDKYSKDPKGMHKIFPKKTESKG